MLNESTKVHNAQGVCMIVIPPFAGLPKSLASYQDSSEDDLAHCESLCNLRVTSVLQRQLLRTTEWDKTEHKAMKLHTYTSGMECAPYRISAHAQ